jgi:Holliday junction resolvase
MTGSEQDLVNAIIEYLQYMGAVAIRINSGQIQAYSSEGKARIIRLAPAGTSDILACRGGRFLAIEAKIYPNQPTEKQRAFLDSVRAAGGLAMVAWSIEDVIERLADEVDARWENE